MISNMNCCRTRYKFSKLALFMAFIPVKLPCPVRAQDQQWLLGDWDGQRRALAEKGFEFEFVLTLEGVQNVKGGISRSSRMLANLDLIIDAGGEALGLSENGYLHLYFLGNSGGAPTEMIGDIQASSNIEAPGTFKLYEAWWLQSYADNKIAWLIGLHDYNALFDVLDAAGHFTNSSFGISPDISQVPPSIFPTTSMAFVASLISDDETYLHLGAYDGVPGDSGDENGTQVIIDSRDGVFYAIEAGITRAETGTKLGIGGWYRTTDFDVEFADRTHSHNSGVYFIGETRLTEHLAGFFQTGNADKNRNQIGFYASTGLVYYDLFIKDDVFGVGLARAEGGSEYRDRIPGDNNYEMAFECTYKFNPRPWITLQPGFQFIKNPGLDPSLDDALAFSLRAYIVF